MKECDQQIIDRGMGGRFAVLRLELSELLGRPVETGTFDGFVFAVFRLEYLGNSDSEKEALEIIDEEIEKE